MEKTRNQIAADWWLDKLSALDNSTMDNGEDDRFLMGLMLVNKQQTTNLLNFLTYEKINDCSHDGILCHLCICWRQPSIEINSEG